MLDKNEIVIKTFLITLLFTGIGTVIIVGGYMIGDYYKNKIENIPVEEEIVITTDKTEYEQGEEVKITIENNSGKDIYYYENIYCYLEYQKENGIWIQSLIINTPCLKGKFGVIEKNKIIYFNIDFIKNNHIYYSGNGKYKITFNYGNSDKNAKEKIIYSDEFIIKEKLMFNTSNWQTYRNEEFGFEVKYPEEWTVISSNMISNLVHFGINGSGGVAVVAVEILDEKNIQEKIDKRKLEIKVIDKNVLITESELFVDNIRTKQIKSLYQPLGSFPESLEISTYFNYKSNLYTIHLSTYKKTEQEAIDIYNLFISTFKFID